MNCFLVKRKSTLYFDGRLRAAERARVSAHLQQCDSCASYFHQVNSLRSGLQSLPLPKSPALLRARLQCAASREIAIIREANGSRLQLFWNRSKFRLEEFMRPLTIPATGGLLSSLALFATLAFSITQTARSVGYEVPVTYEDRTDANLVPVDMRSSIVLTMSLDNKGHILDYAVRDGVSSYTGDISRLSYTNIVMPQFPTVMAVAQPITGDIRISMTPIIFRQ